MNEDIIQELKWFNEEYEKDLTRTYNYIKNIPNLELRKYIENSNSGNILQIIRFLQEENEDLKTILIEFEKWLEEKILSNYANNDMAQGYKNALKICFEKLKELKGEIK